MNIIIFDFEVFKYDTLLGTKLLSDNETKFYQTWDLEEIKKFYYQHENDLWIGHNNLAYDNLILEAIINDKNPYLTSKSIINAKFRPKCDLDFASYDLMLLNGTYSLKATELCYGKNISETQVNFDLDRHLTNDEKLLTESYNRDDLNQTETNLNELADMVSLRLSIIKEFNLDLKSCLNITGTKLGAIVLGAHHIDGIENMKIKPKLYDNLQLKNKALLDFYMNEDFRQSKKLTLTICGEEHQIGQGGIHAAEKCCHYDKALYFDVSGYYNLTMINFDLLPRTLGADGKEKYIKMYHEQLEMKKTHDARRNTYKTILLSVFGAMGNQYTDFYDPEKLLLVTITGQLFIVDLLEKLEPYVKCVQSNTDGIIVSPYDWKNEELVINIVKDWCERTGYVITPKKIYNIWQRDVNCYFYEQTEHDPSSIHVVGEAVRMYGDAYEWPICHKMYNNKEPAIFAFCIIDYLEQGIKPEDTIKKYSDNLILFQFVCKKKSFDWTQAETTDDNYHTTITRLQGVNRAFPSNDTHHKTVIYKCRKDGKVKRARVANLPDNVFVYDDEIVSKEHVEYLKSKIDWQYYVDRAYEKIKTFMKIPVIKELYL